ncbi:MAG: hypothetical protein GY750_18510 [Lentisphaerae bacterium]|nr:hypothetical protein [Lentisphaerota bacterium]MCP4103391.1 hypothetical protein [Lentisphaerota bacterium]
MALNKIAKVLTGLIITSIILLVCVYFYLFQYYMPRYFSQKVLPRLTKEAGIRGFSGKVKRVGMFGADLGQLVIGDPKNPALKVKSVIIRYKMRNFLILNKLKINSIDLRGVELKCRAGQNTVEINHVNLEKFIQLLRKNFRKASNKKSSALSNARISISDGMLDLSVSDKRYLLPFALKMKPLKKDWTSFDADITVKRKENAVSSHMVFNLASSAVEIGYKMDVALNKLKEFFSYFSRWTLPRDLVFDGNAQIEGSLRIGLKKFKLLRFKCHGVSKDAEFNYGRFKMQNRLRASGMKEPLEFILERVPGDLFYMRLKKVLCRKPFNLFLRDVTLNFPPFIRMPVTAQGEVEFELADFRHLNMYDIRALGRNTISRHFKGRVDKQTGSWYFTTVDDVSGKKKSIQDNLVLDIRGFKTFCSLSDLRMIGRGVGNSGALKLDGILDNITACSQTEALSCSNLKFNSNLELGPDLKGNIRLLSNKFNLSLPTLFLSNPNGTLLLTGANLNGTDKFRDAVLNRLSAQLKLKGIRIQNQGCISVLGPSEAGVESYFDARKKRWNCAARAELGNFESKYNGTRYTLEGASLSAYLKLNGEIPKDFKLANCSISSNFDKITIHKNNFNIATSKGEVGLALNFGSDNLLLKSKYNSRIENIKDLMSNCSFNLWKIDAAGDMSSKEENLRAGELRKFINSVQVAKLDLNSEFGKIISTSFDVTVSGGMQSEALNISGLHFYVNAPSSWLIRGKNKLQLSELSLKTDSRFKPEGKNISHMEQLEIEGEGASVSGTLNKENLFCSKPKFKLVINSLEQGIRKASMQLEGQTAESGWGNNKHGMFADKIAFSVRRDSENKSELDNKLDVKISKLFMQNSTTGLSFVTFEFKGCTDNDRLAGRIRGDHGSLDIKNELKMLGIELDIPLCYGVERKVFPGKFFVDKLSFGNMTLGSVDAKTLAQNNAVKLSGKISSQHQSGGNSSFYGKLMLKGKKPIFRLNLKQNVRKLNAPLVIENAIYDIDKLLVNGSLGYDLIFDCTSERIADSGSIILKDADLKFSKWQMDGVNGVCSFDDFSEFSSLPHQVLNAESIHVFNQK